MLTLHTPAGTDMLPPREPNIPLHLFTMKQATGFLLWNGQEGRNAKFYLMKFPRQDHDTPVARFFGGTAIPFPHSLRSTGEQSLIRLAEHFGINLPKNAGDGFIPLHHFMKTETTVSEVIDDPNAQKVRIPVFETHGLLPAEDAFIEAYRDKLIEVYRISGPAINDPWMLCTEDDLPFNNDGMKEILHHLLEQGCRKPEARMVKSEVEPDWVKGDYTPQHDKKTVTHKLQKA